MRLGNLAADMARMGSHLYDMRLANAVKTYLDESKWFCEWAGVQAAANDMDTAHTLSVLQRQLVRWQYHFDQLYADPVRRAEMAETARAWSNHLLVLSGLLTAHQRG